MVDVLTEAEQAMRARWPLLTTLAVLGLGYVAYPYLTLYRLDRAVRQGDTATLQTLVDWPAVRAGIKEDICDRVLDTPQGSASSGGLPPFGASFVRSMTTTAVDQTVTPEALVAVASAPAIPKGAHEDTASRGAEVHVDWAFFSDAGKFTIALRAHGETAPIRLEMTLQHAVWQVRRVWLPPDLLTTAAARI
ncbi:MAG TPA: DUF2939 domain-containing protein [Acetobacteraceae bacterium]|nr:DUF2939 domain-containing protein [Acetobacteraceae bacterium]